jgi:hypothetical protein
MTTIEAYKEGTLYENFINLAHQNKNGVRNGASVSLMQNLILVEKDPSNDCLGSREKRLASVKKYMIKAFDAILKKRWSEADRRKMEELKNFTEKSNSSGELMDIIKMGIEILNKARGSM